MILMKSTIAVYNAFTKEPGKGNPAAVILDAKDLSDKEMQEIAYKAGYNESAFVLPSEQADIRLRFFSPGQEMNLCGHATVASIYALFSKGMLDKNHISIETNAGILAVNVYKENEEIKVYMEQSPYEEVLFNGDRSMLAKALGIQEEDLEESYPIVYGYTGLWTLLVPIKKLSTFKKMKPQNALFPDVLTQNNRASVHPFCMETVSQNAKLHGRHFSSPFSGTVEDPVTGTASGVMGAYYMKHILKNKHQKIEINIEQGHEIGREGLVEVIVEHKEVTEHVRISGTAVFEKEITEV